MCLVPLEFRHNLGNLMAKGCFIGRFHLQSFPAQGKRIQRVLPVLFQQSSRLVFLLGHFTGENDILSFEFSHQGDLWHNQTRLKDHMPKFHVVATSLATLCWCRKHYVRTYIHIFFRSNCSCPTFVLAFQNTALWLSWQMEMLCPLQKN